MKPEFLSFVEIVSQDELLDYLDWGKTALENHLRLGKDDPFAWTNGVHYFQTVPNGKRTFNLSMIKVWMVSKCQNDPSSHTNAVTNFQNMHPGASLMPRRRQKSA